jgi:hypothetical protein
VIQMVGVFKTLVAWNYQNEIQEHLHYNHIPFDDRYSMSREI